MQAIQKLLDIVRDKKNSQKQKEKRKMRKGQTTINILYSLYFVRKYMDCLCRRRSSKILSNGLLDIEIEKDCCPNIFIFEKCLQFRKKQKHLLGKMFGSPHTSNRIYLLRNCFSNYVYLKDMYIALKTTGKNLFVLMLRILLIYL